MIAFPHAKVNLGLHVINKREDGFHNLETAFLSVNYHDMLEVIEAKSVSAGQMKCKITMAGNPVEGDPADNLVAKAYHLLDQQFQLPPVEVFLYKKIPTGAGLGGGSSDAAFMLKLLNEKFSIGLTVSELEAYAAQLGSDCAFFITGNTAYVFGKGHELEPITLNLEGLHIELVCPPIHSSTALAYQRVTPRGLPAAGQSLRELLKQPIEKWKDNVFNDFEPSVFATYPELAKMKQELYDAGAVYASMSGSGSALFAVRRDSSRLP